MGSIINFFREAFIEIGTFALMLFALWLAINLFVFMRGLIGK